MRLDPSVAPIPVAPTEPHSITTHGDTREDPYFWLKDPGYPEVKDEKILAYLREENAYTDAVLARAEDLKNDLFDEIKGRLPDSEESVPWQIGDYSYRWTFEEGAQYRSWWRRKSDCDDWTLILDEQVEARDKAFFVLKDFRISPDGSLLAYSADTTGGERYDIYVRDLVQPGTDRKIASNRAPGVCFDSTASHLVTTEVSEEWRPYKVIATNLADGSETVLYEEKDQGFFVSAGTSSDRRYLIIATGDHITNQAFVVPLNGVASETPRAITDRQIGHAYDLDHGEAGFYIRSNKTVQNFGLYIIEGDGNWAPVIEGDEDFYLTGFQLFQSALVIEYKRNGLDRISYQTSPGDRFNEIAFDDPVCEAGIGHNPDYKADFVRLTYSSMTTPPTVYDMPFQTGQLDLRKRQAVPDGYDLTQLESDHFQIEARDGTLVPVSLVYRKDWNKGSKLHLYGYGAYGLGMTPGFSASRLSLLDRGFAYAIAHIRGGDEKGRAWYEAGKLEHRENTFNDFVDVTRALIDKGLARPKHISISGGSAGGELMGAVLNQAQELYFAAVLHVPFVDVLNTMLDESLPLTPMEWPEWGNPIQDEKAYHLIKGYCPYTNMTGGDCPALFVTGGLADPRVTYWEPAKYVAKLRTLKTSPSPLLLKINMEAGHKGKSGRFDRYKETAEEYSFILLTALS